MVCLEGLWPDLRALLLFYCWLDDTVLITIVIGIVIVLVNDSIDWLVSYSIIVYQLLDIDRLIVRTLHYWLCVVLLLVKPIETDGQPGRWRTASQQTPTDNCDPVTWNWNTQWRTAANDKVTEGTTQWPAADNPDEGANDRQYRLLIIIIEPGRIDWPARPRLKDDWWPNIVWTIIVILCSPTDQQPQWHCNDIDVNIIVVSVQWTVG